MRTARRAMIAGLLGLSALGLVACTKSAAPPAAPVATTTQQQSPPDTLKAALDKLTGASYDLTTTLVDRNSTTTVVASVAARTSAHVKVDGDEAGTMIHVDSIFINDDAWFKVDFSSFNAHFGIDPTKWMKADLSKLGHRTGPPDLTGADVMDTHELFTTVVSVTRADDTHLSGTVDLTAAKADVSDPQTMAAAGPAAKAAPFTVTLDDQGRITDVHYTIPGTKSDFQAHYSNYGSPSPIQPPDPTGVIPMPASVYAAINS
jgi:hypothetical protein